MPAEQHPTRTNEISYAILGVAWPADAARRGHSCPRRELDVPDETHDHSPAQSQARRGWATDTTAQGMYKTNSETPRSNQSLKEPLSPITPVAAAIA